MFIVLVLFTAQAGAQQPAKVYQIGYLGYGAAEEAASRVVPLKTALRDLGYVEGKNLNLIFRWAETAEQLPGLATELVRLKVDLIFAPSSTEVEAARKATKTIPIVFGGHADPVAVGHVASLARPGGNVTGLSMRMPEIVTKQVEIMKEALPRMKRLGALGVVTAPSTRPAFQAVEAAGQRVGVQVLTVPVRTREDLDGAFATMAREHVDAFISLPTPLLRAQRASLAKLSLKYRLPGMYGPKANMVESDGLMSYFGDSDDMTRRAAVYIDKILKGAKPADLPVEQASKYDLVINLKTAKALGITIPPSVLLRADQIIE